MWPRRRVAVIPTVREHAPKVRFSRLTTHCVPILPFFGSDVTLGARKTAQENDFVKRLGKASLVGEGVQGLQQKDSEAILADLTEKLPAMVLGLP